MTATSDVFAARAPVRIAGFTLTDVTVVVGCFLLSRVMLTAVGLLVLSAHPATIHNPMQVLPFEASLPDLYVRWDSFWYLAMAQHGYSVLSTWDHPGGTAYAFYPVYPGLVWLIGTLTGLSMAMAGFVVSNVAFLAALFVILALAETWSHDKVVARFTVALLCFVPESFIFSAVYTESVFLLLLSGSMLLYERKQNLLAGVVAALAALARSNGILVVLYFGLKLLNERGIAGALRFWQQPERHLPIVLAPLGLFAFWWFAILTTGDAFAQKSSMVHGWRWAVDLPWNNIIRHLTGTDVRSQSLMWGSLVTFAASCALLRRDSWVLFAFCLANFLLFWTGTLSNSLIRYSIILFPIYYGLSRILAHRPIPIMLLLGVFCVLNVLMMSLWAIGHPFVL